MTKKPTLSEIVVRRSTLRPARWLRAVRGGEQSHDAIWAAYPDGAEKRVCVVEDTDMQPGVATFILHARTDVDFLLALVFDQAQEIAQLKAGGCARDQGLTQFCAEAAAMSARIKELEWRLAGLEK